MPSVNLLPFHIAYDGRARVSDYLKVRERGTGPEAHRVSAFRGRQIVTALDGYALPADLVGITFTKEQVSGAKKRRTAPPPDASRARNARATMEMKGYSLDSDDESGEEDEPAETSRSVERVLSEEPETATSEPTQMETLLKRKHDTLEPEETSHLTTLKPASTFDRIQIWHPDEFTGGQDQDDLYVKAIEEWMSISRKIHAEI